MDQATLARFKKLFAHYSRGFVNGRAADDENILLKIKHTGRVLLHSSHLAASLNLPPDKQALAETVALFHDVGRFRQYRRYNTFDDRVSANHAELALEVLAEKGWLACLPEAEQALITGAIANHNKLQLPEEIEGRLLLFSQLIRDADKLDVFDVIVANYGSDHSAANPVIDFGLPDTPGYRSRYITDILNNRLCDNRFLENSNDVKLTRLAWVFDLNFAYSFAYVRRTGYIDKIINHLPPTDAIRRVADHLHAFVEERDNSNGTEGEP